MSLSRHFKTVKDLEKNGVPVEYGDNSRGKPIRFFIARAGGANQEYLNYVEALAKPHRRLIQNDTVDSKVMESIALKAFIGKALKGWENVEAEWEPAVEEDVNGEKKMVHPLLEFSAANAERLYTELPDLFQDHFQLSSRNTMYLDEVRKADAKNS